MRTKTYHVKRAEFDPRTVRPPPSPPPSLSVTEREATTSVAAGFSKQCTVKSSRNTVKTRIVCSSRVRMYTVLHARRRFIASRCRRGRKRERREASKRVYTVVTLRFFVRSRRKLAASDNPLKDSLSLSRRSTLSRCRVTRTSDTRRMTRSKGPPIGSGNDPTVGKSES